MIFGCGTPIVFVQAVPNSVRLNWTFFRLVLMISSVLLLVQVVFGQGEEGRPQRSVDRGTEGRILEFHQSSGSHPLIPQSGTDIPFYRANQFPSLEPQNEPSVRISPKDRNRIVVAYRDFRFGSNPAIRNVGIANTTDGGFTWTERLFAYSNHNRDSDPGVAVDTGGNF